jgi:glycosyltransferase involved in cell wall biosynthesis
MAKIAAGNGSEARPRLGRSVGRPGAARFLLVCFYDPNGIAAVYEGIERWQRLSEFNLEILNLWPSRGDWLRLPPALDLAEYDGVIIHAAVSYTFGNVAALDARLARPFEHYDGVKVLMKQDEQRMSSLFAEYLGRKKFDVLLTCVPEPEQPKVYPREQVGDLAFVRVLTGYVTEAMRNLAAPWRGSRPIDIGYRGSIQPLSFGRLGFEKRKIGDDVCRALAGSGGLRLDITSAPAARIHGPGWIDFLAASKATLGVESGSNLFDFDGGVEQWCREFEAAHAGPDRSCEQLYQQAHAEYLCRFEGNVDYAQVSPRHFEAAAARSVQILYEGRYSDIFRPGQHYLPLRRDLANLDEIVDAVADERRCIELSERAFDEIVRDPSYGYESFVVEVDRALDAALVRKGRRRRAPPVAASDRPRPRALILTAVDPQQDPRSEWVAQSLVHDHDVYEFGTYRPAVDGRKPSLEQVSPHRFRLRVERNRHGSWWLPRQTGRGALSIGRQQLLYVAALADAAEPVLRTAIGALDALPEDIANFRWVARYIVNSNSALLEAAQRSGRFDFVVATDLDTLAAGVVLQQETGAALLYDAHEFWPYSMPGARHWYSEFWNGFGRPLVQAADLAVTVSPPLAAVMSTEYGRDFAALPNCASRADGETVDIEDKLAATAGRRDVVFLFQGAFALERGIDRLISAWQYVDQPGVLLLRGPDNDYKRQLMERAHALGLLGHRVAFPPAVAEHELVRAASEADFGVIPYEPVSINNRLCCPNKLSQYLAAGLPVICNELEFVKSVVVGNGIGFAVNFADEKATAAVFNRVIAARADIPAMARRARGYFEQHFNWEHVFEPVRRDIARAEAARTEPRENGAIDFAWIDDPNAMRAPASEVLRSAAFESSEIAQLTGIGQALLRAALFTGRLARMLHGPGRAGRLRAAIRVRLYRVLPARRFYAVK